MKCYYLVICYFFVPLLLFAQNQNDVKQSMIMSAKNRSSLEKLLDDYRSSNEEKYRAACFLIANMPYHFSHYKLSNLDFSLGKRLDYADSCYYSLVKNRSDFNLCADSFCSELSKIDQPFRKCTEALDFKEPEVERGEFLDIEHVTGDMLRSHIEHMFEVRNVSNFIKNMCFEDFLQYVLPYRGLDRVMPQMADIYARRYEKYLHVDTATSIHNVVQRYNITSKRLRYWGGTYPFQVPIGMNEMFFLGYHDCVSTADYCASILRSCGIPAMVEYNVAYKFWLGRHYHVSVKTNKGWETFSPESEIPHYRDPRFNESLNIFRLYFNRQYDNPYSLRSENEPIPEILSNPCIKDVTAEIGKNCLLNLPFIVPTKHKLAYLATFHSQDDGLRPVTWGIINHKDKIVEFKNVVPNHLYYPVYMDDEGFYHEFAYPFVIIEDSTEINGYRICPLKPKDGKKVKAILERKFPRKPHLIEYARKVTGTYIIGSNDPTFHKADTLGMIGNVYSTDWNVLNLNISMPYRFYRICGAGNPARVRLAEIEFLTKSDYGYANTMQTAFDNDMITWVRILDEPLDKCKWKAEYDGNPQTAPDRWPNVTLRLQEPQMVHAIRFMVKHADNAVKDGCTYELREWSDGFWKRTIKCIRAISSKIVVEGLTPGRLYWLHCLDGGNEEMPFCVDENGTQFFP